MDTRSSRLPFTPKFAKMELSGTIWSMTEDLHEDLLEDLLEDWLKELLDDWLKELLDDWLKELLDDWQPSNLPGKGIIN